MQYSSKYEVRKFVVGESLLMQETFLCQCYSTFVGRVEATQSTGACPFISFRKIWRVEGSLEVSVKAFFPHLWHRANCITFVNSLYL